MYILEVVVVETKNKVADCTLLVFLPAVLLIDTSVGTLISWLVIARYWSFYLQFCLLIHCNALIVFLVVPVMLNLCWPVCLQSGILILIELVTLFLVVPPVGLHV
jgi:hypothetical protein